MQTFDCYPAGTTASSATFVAGTTAVYLTVSGSTTSALSVGSGIGALAEPRSAALVPNLGVLILEFNTRRLQLFSTVGIATHPVSVTVAPGATASFSVALLASSSTSGLTYSWTKGGVPVGTNSPIYKYIAIATDAGPAPIVCTVTHGMGRAVSNTAILTVTSSVSGRSASCSFS
jgi:hypothetical protein